MRGFAVDCRHCRVYVYRLELAVSRRLVDVLIGCRAKYHYDFHLLAVDGSRNFSFWSVSFIDHHRATFGR